jgi:peptide deformylase
MKIITPHSKKGRLVTTEDIGRIQLEALEMIELCSVPIGNMQGAFALSHTQVENEDPLSFFVVRNTGRIFCNPEIVGHTKTTVDSEERCLTFYIEREPVIVERWNVVELQFMELVGGELVAKKETFRGKEARVVQHEIDHCNAIYIYDKDSEI